MSRLVIALGFADSKATTPPHVVYCGRDADAMRRALAESAYPVHQLFINPAGIRKHNPSAAANAVLFAASSAAGSGAAAAVDQAALLASNDALQAECMRLQKENAALKVAASSAHIAVDPAAKSEPVATEEPAPAAEPAVEPAKPAAPKPGTRR